MAVLRRVHRLDVVTPNVDLKGARALVTGGAGFVGSHIVDQLIEAGVARVLVIDDFTRGRSENLRSVAGSPALEVITGDICDAALIDRASAGTDFVFHQAALRITQCAENPVRAVKVMVEGTQNVLESAVRYHVTKVLVASSASVYGEPDRLPIQESDAFNNRTIYGAAKIANEQMSRAYAEMYGLKYLALRPFNVYGPRMDAYGVYTEGMIRWLERLGRGEAPLIFGDGAQTMDFVYVGDVARAYLLAATSDATDDVLNVGSGTETSLKERGYQLIPITRPFVGEEEVAAAAEVIRSGWLTQGERVQQFETAVAQYVGAGRAVAVSNCTTALHLALLAASVRPGDEVICPAFSFIATANAIVHAGARPVFVDIDPRTYNIDPELVEAAITPRTKVIMPVDQIGLAADITAIRAIAKRHGVKVVEDAAPSLGAMIGGRRVGSLSDLTCFSFHPRKSITTGEGGAITTDNPEAAGWLSRIRSHGASTSDLQRHHSKTIAFEEYRELGD